MKEATDAQIQTEVDLLIALRLERFRKSIAAGKEPAPEVYMINFDRHRNKFIHYPVPNTDMYFSNVEMKEELVARIKNSIKAITALDTRIDFGFRCIAVITMSDARMGVMPQADVKPGQSVSVDDCKEIREIIMVIVNTEKADTTYTYPYTRTPTGIQFGERQVMSTPAGEARGRFSGFFKEY